MRCIQTADGIAYDRRLTVKLAPGIVETNFGNLGDVPADQLYAEIYDMMGEWISGNEDVRRDGGESFADQKARFLPEVNVILDANKTTTKTIAFVAHGAILALMLPLVFNNIDPAWALKNGFPNTGIASGVWKEDTFVCLSWNGLIPEQDS